MAGITRHPAPAAAPSEEITIIDANVDAVLSELTSQRTNTVIDMLDIFNRKDDDIPGMSLESRCGLVSTYAFASDSLWTGSGLIRFGPVFSCTQHIDFLNTCCCGKELVNLIGSFLELFNICAGKFLIDGDSQWFAKIHYSIDQTSCVTRGWPYKKITSTGVNTYVIKNPWVSLSYTFNSSLCFCNLRVSQGYMELWRYV